MSTSVLIFSKDRPLQLHGTLSSFYLHVSDPEEVNVYVIYKATTVEYAKGYTLIKRELPHAIRWIEERNFKRDVLNVISSSNRKLRLFHYLRNAIDHKTSLIPDSSCTSILFLVDDTIFTAPFSLAHINRLLSDNPDAIGFSLRLGINTTYCYAHGSTQQLPHYISLDEVLKFSWVGQSGDFGYPLEISSSIYRRTDIACLLRKLRYCNPNQLEHGLASSTHAFKTSLKSLLCYEKSVAFSAPINKVQSTFDNKAGSSESYSSHTLNSQLLDGHRIDIAKFIGHIPNGVHQEVVLPFIKTDNSTPFLY